MPVIYIIDRCKKRKTAWAIYNGRSESKVIGHAKDLALKLGV